MNNGRWPLVKPFLCASGYRLESFNYLVDGIYPLFHIFSTPNKYKHHEIITVHGWPFKCKEGGGKGLRSYFQAVLHTLQPKWTIQFKIYGSNHEISNDSTQYYCCRTRLWRHYEVSKGTLGLIWAEYPPKWIWAYAHIHLGGDEARIPVGAGGTVEDVFITTLEWQRAYMRFTNILIENICNSYGDVYDGEDVDLCVTSMEN